VVVDERDLRSSTTTTMVLSDSDDDGDQGRVLAGAFGAS